MPSRAGCGRWAAGAALIVDHDAIVRGIEEAPVSGRRAGSRASVQEQYRFALRVAALLPIHLVQPVEIEHAACVGFDLGVKRVADSGRKVGHYGTAEKQPST